MKKYQLTLLGMSITAFVWGTSFYFIQSLLQQLSYESITLVRFLLATVVLGMWWMIKGKRERIAREDWLRVALGGILGGVVYFSLGSSAISVLSPMGLSAVSGMQPILMMIIESLVIGTLFTGKESMSIALSMIGSILLIESIPLEQGVGLYILQIIATLVWCIYYVIQKPLVQKYSATTLIFFQSLISSIFLLMLGDWQIAIPSHIGLKEWVGLIYLGVGGLGIGYCLNAYALKTLSPTGISVFLNAGPIINLILNWILLGKGMAWNELVGSVLVLMGVVQIVREWLKKVYYL